MSTLRVNTLQDVAGTGQPAMVGAAKAWVNFNGSTTPITVRAQFNVSSITDNGTGDYTVNFSTALSSANYSVLASINRTSGTNGGYGMIVLPVTRNTSNVRVLCPYTNAVNYDQEYVGVAIFL